MVTIKVAGLIADSEIESLHTQIVYIGSDRKSEASNITSMCPCSGIKMTIISRGNNAKFVNLRMRVRDLVF